MDLSIEMKRAEMRIILGAIRKALGSGLMFSKSEKFFLLKLQNIFDEHIKEIQL